MWAGDLARRRRTTTGALFASLGLSLEPEGTHKNYFCTPLNSTTFASTGGDGVHYGLLTIEGSPATPVVMTIPMGEPNNLVIAEDFQEFLRLGYYVGYFSLEQFIYDPAWAGEFHSQDDEEMEDDARALLAEIREHCRLEPLADIGARIREVDARYRAYLQIPDFDEWTKKHGV